MDKLMNKALFLSKLKKRAIKIDSLPTELMQNHVLIEVTLPYEKEVSGIKLLADEDFTSENESGEQINMSDRAPRSGTVIAICDQLYFNKPMYADGITSGTMEWDTDIEVQVGDYVFFSYLKGINADHFFYDDKLYYMIRYDHLYAIKTGSELKPINGWIVFEEVKDDIESSIIVTDFVENYKDYIGTAVYIGKPNRDYIYDADDTINVEVGDVCGFTGIMGGNKMFLEGRDPYMREFDTRYFLFQRRDVGIVY